MRVRVVYMVAAQSPQLVVVSDGRRLLIELAVALVLPSMMQRSCRITIHSGASPTCSLDKAETVTMMTAVKVAVAAGAVATTDIAVTVDAEAVEVAAEAVGVVDGVEAAVVTMVATVPGIKLSPTHTMTST